MPPRWFGRSRPSAGLFHVEHLDTHHAAISETLGINSGKPTNFYHSVASKKHVFQCEGIVLKTDIIHKLYDPVKKLQYLVSTPRPNLVYD